VCGGYGEVRSKQTWVRESSLRFKEGGDKEDVKEISCAS